MTSIYIYIFGLLFLHQACDVTCENEPRDLTQHPGHLKRFGSVGEFKFIEEVDYFPGPVEFFGNYVSRNRPVIMRGVNKERKPYRFWTDQYFLNLPIPPEERVQVQNKQGQLYGDLIHFHDFVRTYRQTGDYMETDVIPLLKPDVVLPRPIQCEDVMTKLHSAHMWLNTGGSKSVVHSDGADNILCLYAGEKQTTMLHPEQYLTKKGIREKMVTVAKIDVDSVDYTKHPELAEIDYYYKAHLTAGDCLYIPYNWIHQVNSFHRNLAVNVWWYHYDNSTKVVAKCGEKPETNYTLADMAAENNSVEEHMTKLLLQYFLIDLTKTRPVTMDEFQEIIIKFVAVDQYFLTMFRAPGDDMPVGFATYPEEFLQRLVNHPDVIVQYNGEVKHLILPLDRNNDMMLTLNDFLAASQETMDAILMGLRSLRASVRRLAEVLKTADQKAGSDEQNRRPDSSLHTEL